MSEPFSSGWIDGHCHPAFGSGSAREALGRLREEAGTAGAAGVLLLNLVTPLFGGGEGFSNAEFLDAAAGHGGYFRPFACLVPGARGWEEELARVADAGARGIKLHPRMHGYAVDTPACRELVEAAGGRGLPVLACGFPDGIGLALGNVPEAFARLARACPGTRVAVAHACGHHLLDAMMHAKAVPNLYLDLSFTPLYYRGSRVAEDLFYMIRSMRGRKLFWGTDFPDRGYGETVALTRELFAGRLEPGLADAVFRANALDFLGEGGAA